MQTAEAIAHYVRGAITLYFLLKLFQLFPHRRRNHLLRMLFWVFACLAVLYVKDAVLLLDGLKTSGLVADLVSITDLVVVPLGCSCLIEAVRPGYTRPITTVVLMLVQLAFLPLCWVWPSAQMVTAAGATVCLIVAYTGATISIYTGRYSRFIEQNFSYTEHLDVRWVRWAYALFLTLFVSDLLLASSTAWAADAVYNGVSLLLWMYLSYFVTHHQIIIVDETDEDSQPTTLPALVADEPSAASGAPAAARDLSTVASNGKAVADNGPSVADNGLSVVDNGPSVARETPSVITPSESVDSQAVAEPQKMVAKIPTLGAEMGSEGAMDAASTGSAAAATATVYQSPAEGQFAYIAQRLKTVMEAEKLYLNPKLSIIEAALAVGTNKTYLSEYLNRRLGQTFFDYINGFRIGEAKRIITNAAPEEHLTMGDVAQRSGFNSVSSFNRYFTKAAGMSAKEYSLQHR